MALHIILVFILCCSSIDAQNSVLTLNCSSVDAQNSGANGSTNLSGQQGLTGSTAATGPTECAVSMLDNNRAILPSEAGQPDEDDFATIRLENEVAKIKFPKPSKVTSLQVRETGGLSADDTVSVNATFVKRNGETKTMTFNGSPEEEGSPITVPVSPTFVPLKELNIRMRVTDEDGDIKQIKSMDVMVKGCVLEKKTGIKPVTSPITTTGKATTTKLTTTTTQSKTTSSTSVPGTTTTGRPTTKAKGRLGSTGHIGPQGPPGISGVQGATGQPGPSGPPGQIIRDEWYWLAVVATVVSVTSLISLIAVTIALGCYLRSLRADINDMKNDYMKLDLLNTSTLTVNSVAYENERTGYEHLRYTGAS